MKPRRVVGGNESSDRLVTDLASPPPGPAPGAALKRHQQHTPEETAK